MEPSRDLVNLPRLADDASVAVPQPLSLARERLHEFANATAAKANQIARDDKLSEVERSRQLTALHDSAVPELSALGQIVASVESLTNESEAATLRRQIASFDQNRLLSIAERVSARDRDGRLNAILLARQGDLELCAALLSAPTSFALTDGIDDRILSSLRDKLLDAADAKVRATCDTTRFACARARGGLEIAGVAIRRLTRVEQTPTARMTRVR